jgi:ribosomal protein S11
MYCVMVKIEESLPWIELKGEYATRTEARQAAQRVMQRIGMKIASIPDEKRPMKALVTVRTRH